MNLYDVVDYDLWHSMVHEGFIKLQHHPTEPLIICNYTPKAQYTKTWNPATRVARGLIIHDGTHDIVARPFPKFFNVGELTDADIPSEPFRVFEKMDGSLGILYRNGDGALRVATRGSFTSDQAQWASAFMGVWDFQPADGVTYLFEIIYPENRIVVDYDGLRTLVLLDVIDNETGSSVMDEIQAGPHRWKGRVVQEWQGFESLHDLLSAEQDTNREGYVIRFESGMRAKVKMNEYVRLHRIITGVSAKHVWELLRDGGSLEPLLSQVPDEFYDWVTRTVDELDGKYNELEERAFNEHNRILAEVTALKPSCATEFRKAYAQLALQSDLRGTLFNLYDRKPYALGLWDRIKPAHERPFTATSEDVA